MPMNCLKLLRTRVRYTALGDDFKMYVTVNFVSRKRKFTESCQWCKQMVIGNLENLPIPKEKTKVLHLGKSIIDSKCTIWDYELQQVEEITDLGFLIGSDLVFDLHGKKVAQKATSMMHNILRGLSTRNQSFSCRRTELMLGRHWNMKLWLLILRR